MKVVLKLIVTVSLCVSMFSCNEKKGFDKVKEGVAEMTKEVSEESKKKMEIKFNK